MNCLEFRRQTMADPAALDATLKAHLKDCAQCSDYYEGLLKFESHLNEAMQIEVPDDLNARIKLNVTLDKKVSPWRSRSKYIAIAASIALTAIIVFPIYQNSIPLDKVVMSHIEHEPYALVSTKAVPTTNVENILADIGYSLVNNIGEITYAMGCKIRGSRGAHLVLAGNSGPITVMVMPAEEISQPMPLKKAGLKGVLVPTSAGSIAIIGDEAENLQELEAQVRSALVLKV